MDKITGRRIQVTKWDKEITVMLSWYDEGNDSIEAMHSKHFHFSNVNTFRKVEETINILVNKWARIFFSPTHMAAVSSTLDENPARFDWIIDHEGDAVDFLLQSVPEL